MIMSNPRPKAGRELACGGAPAKMAPNAASHPTFADNLKKLSDTDLYALLATLKNEVPPEEAKDAEMAYLLKRADRLIADFEGHDKT